MSQLRIGIIGLNARGNQMWPYWHQPDGRSVVVAGVDIVPERLEHFRSVHGGPLFTTLDYPQMLGRADVDAVAIMTPDFCHEEQALAALEAGKHVYLEKPMAITTEGCDRILEAWRRSDKRLMIGFNMRYMNMFRTMKEIVDAGVIGDVRAVWVRHFVGWADPWMGYFYHGWWGVRHNVNSLLLQKGSHDIDIIHWISGRYTVRTSAFGGLDFYGGDKPNDLTCPVCPEQETCADMTPRLPNRCAFRRELDVEDNQVMIMELEGGIKASYLQCHFTPDYHRNYTFIGTEGRLENSEPEMKVWVKTRRSRADRALADRTYDIKPAVGSHNGADPRICKDFVEMVLDDRELGVSPIAGRMSVAAAAAATDSMRNGGIPVRIPPLPPGFR